VGAWEVTSIIDFGYPCCSEGLLYDLTDFDEDLSGWDTSRVTTMRAMFYCFGFACAFNKPVAFDTGSVHS
jgi:surface protein